MPVFQGHTSYVHCAVFSADGKRILSGSADGTVRLWEWEEKARERKELLRCEGHTGGVWAVAFAGAGKLAVSASTDKTVRVWDLENGREIRRMEGHEDRVWALALSSDGRRVYSGGQDRSVRVWDLETGKALDCWKKGHTDPVRALALSPDGKRLVTAEGKVLYVRDATDGRELGKLEGHSGTIDSVTFAPDGRHVLSGGFDDHTLRLWDLQTRKEIQTFKVNSRPQGVAVSPDGRQAACGGRRGCAYLWRLP
jgi:WD40 repeat protein